MAISLPVHERAFTDASVRISDYPVAVLFAVHVRPLGNAPVRRSDLNRETNCVKPTVSQQEGVMETHSNAKLTPQNGPEIVRRVLEEGHSPTVVATAFGVSVRTVHRWSAR